MCNVYYFPVTIWRFKKYLSHLSLSYASYYYGLFETLSFFFLNLYTHTKKSLMMNIYFTKPFPQNIYPSDIFFVYPVISLRKKRINNSFPKLWYPEYLGIRITIQQVRNKTKIKYQKTKTLKQRVVGHPRRGVGLKGWENIRIFFIQAFTDTHSHW